MQSTAEVDDEEKQIRRVDLNKENDLSGCEPSLVI